MFHACNDFCTVLSRTVLNTYTLQTCFCISAHLYLINWFGLLAYSAKHRKSSFIYFLLFFSCRIFSASLLFLNVCNTEILMCGWKDRLCSSFWTSNSMNADLNVFNNGFTSWVSVELEQRVFCHRPCEWMTIFTSEAWWWPTLWFVNIGSYKTCFWRSTDIRNVKQFFIRE